MTSLSTKETVYKENNLFAQTESSPVMAQYFELKEQNAGCLLFFRLGDFYELFFDDALLVSRTLDLTLTKRGQHNGSDIPMCGVPASTVDNYLARLVRKGFRIAIAEQVETPFEAKKRGGKTLVRRAVTRIVTAGTVTEDALLEKREATILACIVKIKHSYGLAWCDLGVGQPYVRSIALDELLSSLAAIDPREIILPDALADNPTIAQSISQSQGRITTQPAVRFNLRNAQERIKKICNITDIGVLGEIDEPSIAALGAMLDYISITQQSDETHISLPKLAHQNENLVIDPSTRRHLEITRTLANESAGSLLHAIDRTLTGAGARMLAAWLASPLLDISSINRRLDGVEHMMREESLRLAIRKEIVSLPDLDRALSRLSLGRGSPRDLGCVRDCLNVAHRLTTIVLAGNIGALPAIISESLSNLHIDNGIADTLTQALAETLPVNLRDGGFIARGFAPELDELIKLRDNGTQLIAGKANLYANRSGVSNLKISYNKILGYFIEVTPSNADNLLEKSDIFIHRQTLASSVRFTTTELINLERDVASAADKALAREMELFNELVAGVVQNIKPLREVARSMAVFDVMAAVGELSVRNGYVRPLLDETKDIEIIQARHPVVESSLGQESFIRNDCRLSDEKRLCLLTGPNMAGKSTWLRQNALIIILAQAGVFVPAKSARIGIVDQIFSRVGAADDLARGQSTFMVEMIETARIIHQASEKSFVVLDEVGRGTSTHDGLALARAIVEHLHNITRCRTLFATHYHELSDIKPFLPAMWNATMRIREWQNKILFLHEVADGRADRSYGVHVARLAGLPEDILTRAEYLLKELETGQSVTEQQDAYLPDNQSNGIPTAANDTVALIAEHIDTPADNYIYECTEDNSTDASSSEILFDAIMNLRPDTLTPRDALAKVYELQELASSVRTKNIVAHKSKA